MATTQGISYPESHNIIARAKDGPFHCQNCEYWNKKATSCSEAHIVEVAKNPQNRYGVSIVFGHAHPLKADDCCDFFEKKD